MLRTGLLILCDPAFAFHYVAVMDRIDAVLTSNTGVDAATLAEVKELRAQGESLYKAGEYDGALAALLTAAQLLGIEDEGEPTRSGS